MSKRIFIAVPISKELQRVVLEWEKDFQDLPVRWLSDKNLHITIVPPWYEDDIEIEKVSEKLKSVTNKSQPLEVVFKRVNYGPNLRQPRLIWAENMPSKKMIELRDEAEEAMGIRSNYREWTMHLTIARFRPETFSSFPIKKLDEIIYWPETIRSLVIMEAHLNPKGAEYDILEEFKFSAD